MTVQGEKMSKSRGNFLEPSDLVATLGADGARFVTLREVPFDRDADVSWDSFVRRYNADLANDFGNLVNRTVSMANRYLDGERPAPVADGSLSVTWSGILAAYRDRLDGLLLHEALAELWSFVNAANQLVDAAKPWDLNKAARAGDGSAGQRLRDVLGDLIEACRLIGLAAAPFTPNSAPRVLAQLGFVFAYRADGNGGPPLLDELRWGAHAAESGRLAAAQPLFPRLEAETATDPGGA
jgi:methionyl-tRNA synthetase